MSLDVTVIERRLTKIETQISGIGVDIAEIKQTAKATADIMAQLHVSFVPRTEIEKMDEIRDKEKFEIDRQLEALWKKVDEYPEQVEKRVEKEVEPLKKEIDHLKAWRNWLTGALAVIVGLLGLIAQFGHWLFPKS